LTGYTLRLRRHILPMSRDGCTGLAGKERWVQAAPFKLPLKDRLLMLLMYYRLYVTSTLLSHLFDLG